MSEKVLRQILFSFNFSRDDNILPLATENSRTAFGTFGERKVISRGIVRSWIARTCVPFARLLIVTECEHVPCIAVFNSIWLLHRSSTPAIAIKMIAISAINVSSRHAGSSRFLFINYYTTLIIYRSIIEVSRVKIGFDVLCIKVTLSRIRHESNLNETNEKSTGRFDRRLPRGILYPRSDLFILAHSRSCTSWFSCVASYEAFRLSRQLILHRLGDFITLTVFGTLSRIRKLETKANFLNILHDSEGRWNSTYRCC